MALTGAAAVEAVQTMMTVGNRGASFDGRRVLHAIRTGRSKLVIAGIRIGRGVPLTGAVGRFVAGRGPSRSPRRSRRLSGPRTCPSDGRPPRPVGGWA